MTTDAGRWKINKEISLGDVLAIVLAFASILFAYATLNTRLTVIEEKVTLQAKSDARQDEEALRYQQRFDVALATINAKLDRLIERNGR